MQQRLDIELLRGHEARRTREHHLVHLAALDRRDRVAHQGAPVVGRDQVGGGQLGRGIRLARSAAFRVGGENELSQALQQLDRNVGFAALGKGNGDGEPTPPLRGGELHRGNEQMRARKALPPFGARSIRVERKSAQKNEARRRRCVGRLAGHRIAQQRTPALVSGGKSAIAARCNRRRRAESHQGDVGARVRPEHPSGAEQRRNLGLPLRRPGDFGERSQRIHDPDLLARARQHRSSLLPGASGCAGEERCEAGGAVEMVGRHGPAMLAKG
jgi:hypothetical protein